MSTPQDSAPREQPSSIVPAGALLSLIAIPLGVILLVLLSSIGLVASLVGFAVAYAAIWLYRAGAGSRITRAAAWYITIVVAVTLIVGLIATLLVDWVGGIGHLDRINDPTYTSTFVDNFPAIAQASTLTIVLVLAFGALGSFRQLGRAFRTSRLTAPGPVAYPVAPTPAGQPPAYLSDVDGAPTASADEKTAPPASQV